MSDKPDQNINNNYFSGPSDEIDFEPLNFDIEELDDVEYQIPKISEPPSLESILNESDDRLSLADETDSINFSLGVSHNTLGVETNSETQSVASQRSRASADKKKETSTAVLRHVVLKAISSQIVSASERLNAGSATAVAFGSFLAIGMSHGVTLVFDGKQSLRWCLNDPENDQGSVSSLSFNEDSTRLLIGFARGHILMYDLTSAKLLRTLTDVHPPGTAVLSLKFTDSPALALCSDSGGSVFELNFKRTLGVRGCDSKCLFSGSRGEVCAMSPLVQGSMFHPLRKAVIVAMATLSKVIVVSIRPKLRVILVRQLPPGSNSLPLLAWQFSAPSLRHTSPVLACAKSDHIDFYQVSLTDNKLRISALPNLVVGYSLLAIHWLNAWTVAIVDTAERLHMYDVHNQEEIESRDISSVGLLYESSHFKGIFTGNNVSMAMARAGEKACYNTVVSHAGQLLILASRTLHALTIRPWNDRLSHLVKQKKYPLALSLGLSFCEDPKSVTGVKRERRRQAAQAQVLNILQQFIHDMATPEEDIPTIIQYAVIFKCPDLIYGALWDAIFLVPELKTIYLTCLEPYILNEELSFIPPTILQQFVLCYEQAGKFQALEACILHVDILSLDLHQVIQICWSHFLYDGIIFIQNKAFGDYTTPLQDLLPILQTALSSGRELSGKEVELGNKLFVYISCCLAGRGYPIGDVPADIVQTVKHDIFKSLTALHSRDAGDDERPYPFLRTLLHFDTREFLNVISLAFTEPEFTTELGLQQRQRLVDILLQIMVNSTEFSASQVGALFTFLARQLSRPGSGLQVKPQMFHPVFELLTEASPAHREERQQTLLELLRAAGLQEYPKEKLLERAKLSEFYRVCEVIYEQTGEWDQVFACYLGDPLRRPQVFSFLRNIFLLYQNPTDLGLLLDAVAAHIPQLLQIDLNLTAGVIATHLMDRLPRILVALHDDKIKKMILNAVVFKRKNESEEFPLLCKKYFEEYLTLMTKLEPESVVALLSTHSDEYEVEKAASIVQLYGHSEAQAFLFEKSGDLQSAMRVLSDKLQILLNEDNEEVTCSEMERIVTAIVRTIQLPQAAENDSERSQLWTSVLNSILVSKQTTNATSGKTTALQMVLAGSLGFSNPSVILDFLLRHPAYSGATFKQLKHLFTGMLENSRYEATLASICLRLVNQDLHTQLASQLRSVRRGIHPCQPVCAVCGQSFQRSSVILFPCSHPVHQHCSNSCQCPVCSTIAVDRARNNPVELKFVSESLQVPSSPDLTLKLSAPPAPDLENLF